MASYLIAYFTGSDERITYDYYWSIYALFGIYISYEVYSVFLFVFMAHEDADTRLNFLKTSLDMIEYEPHTKNQTNYLSPQINFMDPNTMYMWL